MESSQINLIIALLGAVSGVIALLRGWRKDRAEAKKAEAEAAGSHVLSSMELVDRLETRLDKMEGNMKVQDQIIASQNEQIASQNEQIVVLTSEVNELKDEREILLKGIESLCEQIQGRGEQPVWTPDVDEDGRIVG